MNKTDKIKNLQSLGFDNTKTATDKKLKYLSQNEDPYLTISGELKVKTSYAGGRDISELLTDWLLSA